MAKANVTKPKSRHWYAPLDAAGITPGASEKYLLDLVHAANARVSDCRALSRWRSTGSSIAAATRKK